MPEYAYTLRIMLPDEDRAFWHLSNLVSYLAQTVLGEEALEPLGGRLGRGGFPAAGELWEVEPDGTRRLLFATDARGLSRAQREERAIEALRSLDISRLGGEGTLRRMVQAVLDA